MLVSSVAASKDVTSISIIGVKDEPGVASKIFLLLAKEGVNIDLILQSIGRHKTKDISFVIHNSLVEHALMVLKKEEVAGIYNHLVMDERAAKVSIGGAGMMSNPGVASLMFEALYNYGINIKMIFTSEIKLTVLIDEDDMSRAVKAIKDKFVDIN